MDRLVVRLQKLHKGEPQLGSLSNQSLKRQSRISIEDNEGVASLHPASEGPAPLASLESSYIADKESLKESTLSLSAPSKPCSKFGQLVQGIQDHKKAESNPESTANLEEVTPNGTVPSIAISPTSSPGSPHSKLRWSKLRSAMTLSTAIGHVGGKLKRQDSFIKKFTTQRGGIDEEVGEEDREKLCTEARRLHKLREYVVDPQGTNIIVWLLVVTLAVLYNLWTVIARQAFQEIRIGYDVIWFITDGICDFIYIVDIVVQMRTSYLERGLSVLDNKKLAQRYIHSRYFVLDLLSVLPLDLFQFLVGIQPMLRFPRFVKIYRAVRWKVIVENRTIFPNAWRVANLTHILFLGCHWFAAFYFLISKAEGFVGEWGYPKPEGEYAFVTRKYLKSFYWSTLTLTTIGDLPIPDRNWEYVFTIASYLIGVFVFATIVGQIGNVITNRNATRLEFEKILDNAKNYMRVHNVPKDLQRRVIRWYDYAWSRGRSNGGGDINSLGLLPDKLKTEMALHVNLETLKRVTIFQECRPEFLHDLVLKMRPYIFTPGDLICRKGEVAREMFIIADGVLEVISDSGEVLSRMGSGDFFGEIGILNLDGGVNRRTADVKSIGYSELFVLSKEDVLTALQDHPDAEMLIVEYGTRRLNEIKNRREQHTADHVCKKGAGAPFQMLPGLGRKKLPASRVGDPKLAVPSPLKSLITKIKTSVTQSFSVVDDLVNGASDVANKQPNINLDLLEIGGNKLTHGGATPVEEEMNYELDDCLMETVNDISCGSSVICSSANSDQSEADELVDVVPSQQHKITVDQQRRIRHFSEKRYLSLGNCPAPAPHTLKTPLLLRQKKITSPDRQRSQSLQPRKQSVRGIPAPSLLTNIIHPPPLIPKISPGIHGIPDSHQMSGTTLSFQPRSAILSGISTTSTRKLKQLRRDVDHSGDSVSNLMNCINELVASKTMDMEERYLHKIHILENENTEYENKIHFLEDQLRQRQFGGIQNTAFDGLWEGTSAPSSPHDTSSVIFNVPSEDIETHL